MTSIFVVHSNITLLATYAVIQQYEVKKPQILVTENYQSELLSKFDRVQTLPNEYNILLKTPTYGNRNILSLSILIKKLDSFISEIAQKSIFDLYIPHSKNFFYQVLLTSKKCRQLNYIDEGLLSYTDNFHKDTLSIKMSKFDRLVKFNLFNRTNILNSIKKDFTSIYRFVNIKENSSKVRILNWPMIDVLQQLDLTNSNVFILDNPVDGNVCSRTDYYTYLTKILPAFSCKKVYIKNHPRETDVEGVLKIFQNYNIDYSLIDDSMILEIALLNSKKLSVYGCWSSLLFYASSMGHGVFSFINIAKSSSNATKKWIDNSIPDVFYNSKIYFN